MMMLVIILTFAILLSFLTIKNSDNSFHIDRTKRRARISPKRRNKIPMYYDNLNKESINHIATSYQDKKNWRVENILGAEIRQRDLLSKRIRFSWLRFLLTRIEMSYKKTYNSIKFELNNALNGLFIYNYIMFHIQTKQKASRIAFGIMILLSSGVLLYQIDPVLIYINLMSTPVILTSASLNMPQIYVINDRDTINNQIAEAIAINAEEIHFDPTVSTYLVSTAITSDLSNITIYGHGVIVTNDSGNNSIISYTTGVGTPYPLTANNSEGDTTITVGVGNIGNFAVNDIVKIYDDTTIGTSQRGELMKIRSVNAGAGTFDTFEGCTYNYQTLDNAEVAVVTTKDNITIKDITFQGQSDTAPHVLLLMDSCKNIKFSNTIIQDGGQTGITLKDCYITSVTNSEFNDCARSGTGYGIKYEDANRNCIVSSNCVFNYCRHGITHGHSASPIGLTQVSKTTSSLFINCNGYAWDTHEECGQSISIESCEISNCWGGIQLRNNYGAARNNDLFWIGYEDIGGVHGAGISAIEGDNQQISGNNISHTYSYGIHIERSGGNEGLNIQVIGNQLTDNGTHAIYIVSCQYITVNENHVYEATDRGIWIHQSDIVVCQNNLIKDSGSDGIHCVNSVSGKFNISGNEIFSPGGAGINAFCNTDNVNRGHVINTNHIYAPSGYGIYLSAGTNTVIDGNKIYDSGNDGIYVNNSNVCSVTNNHMYGCDAYGIDIGTATSTAIHGNYFDSNASGTINNGGTTTIIGLNSGHELPQYANNAAAVGAGLGIGSVYRITGTDQTGYVHS